MTSKETGETEDKELLDRYRRASDREVSAPSDAVRAAILAEGRRVAERLAKQGPAANDSRWKITAFGTMGTALLAALLIAPRYWETLPAAKERAAPTVAPASELATAPPSSPQAAPLAVPRPKLESLAPAAASDALQDVVVTGARRQRVDAQAEIAAKPAAVPPKDRQLSNAPAPLAAPGLFSNNAQQKFAASRGVATPSAPLEEKTPFKSSLLTADKSVSNRIIGGVPSPSGPLQSAAESGDVVLAATLLDRGVSVNSRDAQGRTALMLAISQGQLEVVRLLLQRGADPNAADNAGKTPLQQATAQDLKDIVALLKGAGAR
jgi:hypothetical protein